MYISCYVDFRGFRKIAFVELLKFELSNILCKVKDRVFRSEILNVNEHEILLKKTICFFVHLFVLATEIRIPGNCMLVNVSPVKFSDTESAESFNRVKMARKQQSILIYRMTFRTLNCVMVEYEMFSSWFLVKPSSA